MIEIYNFALLQSNLLKIIIYYYSSNVNLFFLIGGCSFISNGNYTYFAKD